MPRSSEDPELPDTPDSLLDSRDICLLTTLFVPFPERGNPTELGALWCIVVEPDTDTALLNSPSPPNTWRLWDPDVMYEEAATECVSSSCKRSSWDPLLDILEDKGLFLKPPIRLSPAFDPLRDGVVAVVGNLPAPTVRTRFCNTEMPGLETMLQPQSISIWRHLWLRSDKSYSVKILC